MTKFDTADVITLRCVTKRFRYQVGFKSKWKHSAEPVFHLLNCNIVILVILKSRDMQQSLHLWPFSDNEQPWGHFRCVVSYVQRKCYRTSHNQPCIERADCCAEVNLRPRTDNVEVFFFADDCTTHCIAVTVDVLFVRLSMVKSAPSSIILVERRSKCVVNRQKCAVCISKFRNLFNASKLSMSRIARCFNVNELVLNYFTP